MSHRPSLLFALAALLLTTGLAGCTDDLAGPDGVGGFEAGVRGDAPSGIRHAHLAVEAEAEATAERRDPRAIVLFQSTTVDGNAFLRRYSFLEQSAFLRRYGGPDAGIYGVSAEVNLAVFVAEYCDDDDDRTVPPPTRGGGGFECDDDGGFLDDVLELLGLDEDVRVVEPDVSLGTVPDPIFQQGPGTQLTPWGITRVGADAVTLPPGALAGVDLYVFDTAILTGDLEVVERLNRFNYRPDTHGYHVAGTAAAEDDTDGVVGVAPGARVQSFALLNEQGQSLLTPVILAIEEVRRRRLADPARPVVVNMSFGADIQTAAYNALDEAVAAAIEAGVVVVVAAGNDGINAATVTPAHVPGALTVGAYDPQDRFASFSNFGPLVDLLAPGVGVLSLGIRANGTPGLAVGSGTSMSAPHVAGAAAVYLALYPSARPAEVEAALVAAGRPEITGVPGGTTNRTVWLGDGFGVRTGG